MSLVVFYWEWFAFQRKLNEFLDAKKGLELVVPDLDLSQSIEASQIIFDKCMVGIAAEILNLEKCEDRSQEVDSNLQVLRTTMRNLQTKSNPFNIKGREWSEYFNQARMKLNPGERSAWLEDKV